MITNTPVGAVSLFATMKTRILLPLEVQMDDIILYQLIKTKRRLTFDIIYQREDTRYQGEDDGDYFTFRASNGYEVISRSRMDIQTERLWLLGASEDERSGSMVFSSDEKRDKAYTQFELALTEWVAFIRDGGWRTRCHE